MRQCIKIICDLHLDRCQKDQIMPEDLRLPRKVQTHKAGYIIRTAERQLLNQRIRNNNTVIIYIKETAQEVQTQVKHT